MVRWCWEDQMVRVDPAFFDCWEAQVFLKAIEFTPLPVVIAEWHLVASEAQELGIEFRGPVVSG
jgi:hypothetical protein